MQHITKQYNTHFTQHLLHNKDEQNVFTSKDIALIFMKEMPPKQQLREGLTDDRTSTTRQALQKF